MAFLTSATAQQWGCGVKVKAADRPALDEAVALYGKRQYHDAARQLRRLAQRNPKAAEPQFWLGMCAVKEGFNTAGIRRYFNRCLELCPTYPNALAHFYKAVILYTDERYEEATASLDNYFALANGSDDKSLTAVYEEASNYLYWSQFLAEATLNAAPFEPQRVAGVSSRHDEALPYLSPDGRTFYYLRQLPSKRQRSFYTPDLEEKHWQLCASTWLDTAFSAGAPLPAPFNQGLPEGSVSLTADGTELYYSRIRETGGYANSDLYRVCRNADGRWGAPEPLPAPINSPKSWESQPSVSPDGNVLVFASNRPGGIGGIDLWRCRRLKNGTWSRPENLGPAINTTGNEKAPHLAADGHTLYFLSDGWQGFGGYDIYFADLADRSGQRPTNLGLPINTEGDEVSFGVSADGQRAYFAGRTPESRSTDVLMFDLYPAAQPEPMHHTRFSVGIAPHSTADSVCATLHRPDGTSASYHAHGGRVSMMLPEKGESLVSISSGRWEAVAYVSPRGLDGTEWLLTPSDTVPLDLTFLPGSRLSPRAERLLDVWAAYLLAHPLRHAAIECPRMTDAKAAYTYLVDRKQLRPSRLSHRGGTDVDKPRLILQ